MKIRETHAAGEAGPIRVRLYRPEDANGMAPVLVWAHGGGWVGGDLDGWDAPLARLARHTGAVVASVDYRLAPATRFPGSLHDFLAALRHLAGSPAEFGIDENRIAAGGDSAGGNLAAGAALALRDGAGGPRLAAAVLVHPPLDPATQPGLIGRWRQYLPDLAAAKNPYAAPLRAVDLAGLPATIIATAADDPVRTDGERYARRLARAGVPVRVRRFPDAAHGFIHHAGPASRAFFEWIGDRLTPILATGKEISDARLPGSLDAALRRTARR